MDFSVSSDYENAFKKNSLDLNMSYNENNEDDQAESVDSGCVPDLTPETSWLQISSALKYEYGFISSLLQHTTYNRSKSSVASSSPNKCGTVPSTSACEESKPLECKETNSSNINTPSSNVTQKRKLEKELKRIKKGKLGNLSESEAPSRILEIKKKLKDIDTQNIKDKRSSAAQQKFENKSKLGNLSVAEESSRIHEVQKELKDVNVQNLTDKKINTEEQDPQSEGNAISSAHLTIHPVAQKKMLENELRRLKRGKLGDLSASQAKKREAKIKKHLHVMEKQQEKTKKLAKREQNKLNVPSVGNTQKIYNSCGKLVYSKFDFSDSAKEKWTENNKPDLNYYMTKVIKEKERIEKLTAGGMVNEAATYVEKKLWNNAMKRVQGEKVRDNGHKLKKSMERKKHQKKKSAAKWNERISTVKKFQDKKQDKRTQNLNARKQSKQQKSKGKKKGKGKGKNVPGF